MKKALWTTGFYLVFYYLFFTLVFCDFNISHWPKWSRVTYAVALMLLFEITFYNESKQKK